VDFRLCYATARIGVGALASGFATTQLHHLWGHDLHPLVEAMTPEMERRFEAEAERIIEWVSSVPFPGLPKHCVQNFYNS
jgi:hypothetical protein